MSTASDTLDQAVAASKETYAKVDLDCLKAFLEKTFNDSVTITKTGGGAEKSGSSSGILIFDVLIGDGDDAESKCLVLRYDPMSDNRLFYEYDLESQYRIMHKLTDSGLPVPRVYGIDADGKTLGLSGFVMNRVDGEPIPTSLFSSGPLVEATEAGRDEIYQNIVDTLFSIHSLDYTALGLADVVKPAEGINAQEKLVNWWWQTWQWAKPEHYDRLVPVRQWLLDNLPPEDSPVLMHGDPNLGNYMLKDGKVTAILDWELSSIGSPELDLALQVLSMEAHLDHADQLPVKPPTQEQWLDRYSRAGGRQLKNFGYFRKQAAYEIVICFGSMCRYLPDDIRQAYQQMAEFYWAVIENEA